MFPLLQRDMINIQEGSTLTPWGALGDEALMGLRYTSYKDVGRVALDKANAIQALVFFVSYIAQPKGKPVAWFSKTAQLNAVLALESITRTADSRFKVKVSEAANNLFWRNLVDMIKFGDDDLITGAVNLIFHLTALPRTHPYAYKNQIKLADVGAIEPLVALSKRGTEYQRDLATAMLAWLPVVLDRDGDGLIVTKYGGIDPLIAAARRTGTEIAYSAALALFIFARVDDKSRSIMERSGCHPSTVRDCILVPAKGFLFIGPDSGPHCHQQLEAMCE